MAVPIVDDDQADTTVHLKDLYRDNNDADDSGDSNKRTAAELKVIRDRNRFDKAKMTEGHSVVVLCTAIACVMTVLKQWVHEELADNRNTVKDLSVSYQRSKIKDNKSIQLTMKEYFKTKEFLHGFVKTFQCIPQQLLDIFMLKPQEYNKYIDGKIDLSSSMNDSMQFEWSRLSSFANFSNSNISVIRLAEAGFFYQGNGDEVSCYFCELKHKNWNSRDNPSTIHKEHSPHCAFVRKNLNSKIPKSEDTVKPLPERQIGIESIGACGSRTDTIAVKSDTKLNKTCMNHEQNVGDTTNISPGAPEPLLAGASVNQGDDEQLSVVRANQDIEHNQNLATFNAHDSDASLLRSEEGRPRLEQQRSTMYNNSGTMDFQTSNQRGPNQTFNNFSRNDTTGLIPIQNFDTAAHYSNRSSQHVPSETTLTATFNQDNIGVCVEKPKYPKYAVRATRLSSFLNWSLHLTQTPEELATSGFFYTGTEDHCRCFFCGGGLRRWEVGDLPWTEHARWFPKCPFVIQCKGEKFIDDVQKGRNTENAESGNTEEQTIQSHGINGFTNNPAVQTILEFGYEMAIVKTAYTNLRRAGIEDITASLLLETLYEMADNNQHSETSTEQSQNSNIKTENVTSQLSINLGNEDRKENMADVDPTLELSIRSLEEENRNLKDLQTCKICLDEPVAIVFLPCGHMAACVNCAPALRRCPICRAFIKGTVKAIMC